MMESKCEISTCRAARDQVRAMDLMLREANHRIANSLQAAMSATSLSGPEREASATARGHVAMRVGAIAAMHRMLSVSAQSGVIAFGNYLEELVANLAMLWTGPGMARIMVHHSGETVGADAAVRLGMIVNELVTNSCKYAYPGGCPGEVRVGFSINAGSFLLIVADDGRGFEPGAGARRGTGSRLIAELASRLEAEFRYEQGRPGTVAILSGPAALLLPEAIGDVRGQVRTIANHALRCSHLTT